ncbi:MAG: DUF3570 domain-containing protein [Colwellia sp.]|nr:DUF3570 domain-containing protein [Colwellia sp.]
MQLITDKQQGEIPEQKINIKAALTIATTALFAGIAQADTLEEDNWEFDTAFLLYSEVDRVSAGEVILNAKKTYADEEVLNLKLTIDALTGASANGAVAQPYVQTFTRPSGNGQYDIAAGDTPLDDTFHDTRVQLNAQWTQPISSDYTGSAGIHISKEYDYLSIGINGNLAVDFLQKNTTFSIGASYFQDTFTPEGGIPKPFASMLIGDSSAPDWHEDFAKTRIGTEDDKTTTDVLLGFTQVINRRMIMQFNYSYSMVDGYLTDPFKILSIVNNEGLAQDYVYENRPEQRIKQSAYLQSMYHFDTTVLDLSYRYMWDDWDIESHTIDSRLRIPLGTGSYIQPHVRYYQQSAANFYAPYLMQSDFESHRPEFASADYRIGEMTAYTLGLKYGMKVNNGHDLSFRLEYYHQAPTDAGFEAPGVLANEELYPTIDAIIAQVTYSF